MLRIDSFFAVCILLLSSLGAIVTYDSLLSRERPDTPFENLPVGQRYYGLSFAGSCFTVLDYDMEYDGAYNLYLKMSITATTGTNDFDANIQAQIYFNSLGQMTNSLLMIRSNQGRVELLSEGVNPIALTAITYNKENQEIFRIQRKISGPIELIELEGGSAYRIQYRSGVQNEELNQKSAEIVKLINDNFSFTELDPVSSASNNSLCKDKLSLDGLLPVLLSKGLPGMFHSQQFQLGVVQ